MPDREPLTGRRRGKPLLRVALYAAAAVLLLVALFFLLLQSPFFVNRLAGLLAPGGYSIRVKGVSVSPALKGEVSGLQVSRPGDGLVLSSPLVEFKGRITPSLQGEVEEAVLRGPKFFIRLGGAKGEGFDLSILEKIPPIRLLRIEKGEVRVFFASSAMGLKGIDITGLELTLRGFSAGGGGKLYLKGSAILHPAEKGGAEGKGRFEGSVDLAGLLPSPAGEGSFKIFMDSASYKEASLKETAVDLSFALKDGAIKVKRASFGAGSLNYGFEDKTVSFENPSALLAVDYDTKRRGFSATLLEAQLPPLGSFKGSLSGSLEGARQWKSSLEATSLDIQRAFALSKPYLPPKYRGWSLGGKGEGKLDIEGTYGDKTLSWAGDLVFKIRKGEFSSPDGNKAGAGLSGRVVLKLRSLPRKLPGDKPGHKKIDFEASSSIDAGEVLFGRYYRALSEGDLSLRARGSFFLTSFRWSSRRGPTCFRPPGTTSQGRWGRPAGMSGWRPTQSPCLGSSMRQRRATLGRTPPFTLS